MKILEHTNKAGLLKIQTSLLTQFLRVKNVELEHLQLHYPNFIISIGLHDKNDWQIFTILFLLVRSVIRISCAMVSNEDGRGHEENLVYDSLNIVFQN